MFLIHCLEKKATATEGLAAECSRLKDLWEQDLWEQDLWQQDLSEVWAEDQFVLRAVLMVDRL